MKLTQKIAAVIYDELYNYDPVAAAMDSLSTVKNKELQDSIEHAIFRVLSRSGAVTIVPAHLIDID